MSVLNEYPEYLSLLSVYDFPSNVRPYVFSISAPNNASSSMCVLNMRFQ